MLVATRAQLVATRAQLEHRIAVLKSELGARADRAARHPHPHPRVRGGVFTKTMGELRGAIHALMGAGGAARATTPSGLHEALREGPAPAQRKSVQSAASRVNSLVKVLEKSESAALSSAQKIERQIERLKNPGATLSAHPRHDRELAQLAAHERRAGAVLASLRLQQDLSGVRCAVPGKAGGGAVSRRYRMYFVLLLLMSFVHVLYLEHTLNVCHLGNLCVFYLGNVCVFDLHRLYMHIHIHTTYTHTYTHIHTYIHTYIHTHTHTYTHTYIHPIGYVVCTGYAVSSICSFAQVGLVTCIGICFAAVDMGRACAGGSWRRLILSSNLQIILPLILRLNHPIIPQRRQGMTRNLRYCSLCLRLLSGYLGCVLFFGGTSCVFYLGNLCVFYLQLHAGKTGDLHRDLFCCC